MKIVLQEDVENLGKKGDIKEVSDGYARNYLMPRKLVEVATPHAINMAEKLKKQRAQEEQKKIKNLEKMADGIKGIKIELREKVKEDGIIFGSVKAEKILKALNNQVKAEFSKDMIQLDGPIKKIGEYPIKIRISKEIETEIKLIIKEEK